MKKLVLIIYVIFAYTNATYSAVLAEPVCPKVMEPITNSRHTIEMWGDDYVPCVYQEWHLIFPEERQYVEINYTIDLNPMGAIDCLWIYVLDDNNKEVDILGYNYQPMSGKKTVKLNGGSARVVLLSGSGNSGELYRGFKLSFDFANDEIQNSKVIYSNLGIGIQPEERLHVNGAVRGDGANGSLRIRTTTGTTEIGSSSADYSHFYTDRQAFFFNKPLYINGGIISSYGISNALRFRVNNTDRMVIDGENILFNGYLYGPSSNNGMVRIQTSYGYTDIGAVNSGYSHFYTDMPGFYFNKPLTVNEGTIRSASGYNLYLNTFSTTRMTILSSNGFVGIGTQTPKYMLDVSGDIHADDLVISSSLKAQTANITSTINAGTITANELITDGIIANGNTITISASKVNVKGQLRADEIVVNTGGADFVFDKNYELRSLNEVKTFIEENQHLPEIQSARTMQEEGVSLDKLTIQLLQKIEELTLYIIQQEERISELEQNHK